MQNTYVNIDKVKCTARAQGMKIKYICGELGLAETYLSNVKNGKDRMTDDRLYKIADILGTSYEYLTDQTDDPRPLSAVLAEQAEDGSEKLLHLLMGKLPEISPEAETALEKLLSMPTEDFERTIKAVAALIG